MKHAKFSLFALTLSLVTASGARADSVSLGGVHYDGVYVIESERAYYVCDPRDGHSFSVAKSDPSLEKVTLTKDRSARRALYAEFKVRKTETARAAGPASSGSSRAPEHAAFNIEIGSRASSIAPAPPAKPAVPFLRLKGEPRAASPEIQLMINANLAQTAGSRPPVDRAMSGANGGFGASSGNGASGAANAGGGFGAGGAGGGGFGGGGAAGGGGAPGGGSPAGGGGGGGAGGRNSGSFGFSNISQLFGTIPDAAVGESPNPITGR